jgi:hypothetical protein
MMNQSTVIYIILSAILLYLYYKRGEFAIFAAFVVVVAGTFFAGAGTGSIEGMSKKKGSGSNKECEKMGFTTPKIKKNNMKGGITNAMNNIKKVAKTGWPFEDYIGNKPTNDKVARQLKEITNNVHYKSESRKIEENKEKQENTGVFLISSVELYESVKKNEKIDEAITKITDNLANGIKGGKNYLSLLKSNHQFLVKEYKVAKKESPDIDDSVLKLSKYLVCLCTQWLSIWNQIQKANGNSEGDDDAGDDEEEKPAKKKKKASKKKKSDGDDGEDGEDGEDGNDE